MLSLCKVAIVNQKLGSSFIIRFPTFLELEDIVPPFTKSENQAEKRHQNHQMNKIKGNNGGETFDLTLLESGILERETANFLA